MGNWARSVTSKAFFVIVFVILSAIGVAKMLGLSDNDILETVVVTVIAVSISQLITFFVFRSAARDARG